MSLYCINKYIFKLRREEFIGFDRAFRNNVGYMYTFNDKVIRVYPFASFMVEVISSINETVLVSGLFLDLV